MDSAVTAAGRALRAGDPLGALRQVALRDDPAALALRGIAMAQLGDLGRARELLRRAAGSFGPREVLARARCRTAEAEVALAARDLAWPPAALARAARTLAARGDRENATHARLLQARRLLLLGRVNEADTAASRLPLRASPPHLRALAALVACEIALRHGRAARAHEALAAAREAASQSGIGALAAEVEEAGRALTLPAARLVTAGEARSLTPDEVEVLVGAPGLLVDGCRRVVRRGGHVVRLGRRPALFGLLRVLAEAWPGAARRDALIEQAFGARRPNASHRVRLRVGMARLRRELRGLAEVRATADGFALVARGTGPVQLLAPPIDSPGASVLALLADGEAWSTSALALALGASPRTVQRTLAALAEAGQVRALGRGRARRWLSAPVAGFATHLLLPAAGGFG
ncbi:MAG: helix-turn-helix domain-containing protein [Deltaproteobacteria bacterium]|nr:helix-turn-helix domain-containing protein [Deltaproteobacteria bacterium]